MPELKIPATAAPYLSPAQAAQAPVSAATSVPDVGTKALVARLQEKLDATIERAHESKTDIWQTERDDEIQMLRGALSSLEKQSSGSVQTLAQQQAEQARQLRELFEQQAKNRPRKIKAPSGKIYEVIE